MYRCIEEKDADDESVGKWRLEGSGVGGPPCYSKLKKNNNGALTLTETETETEMDEMASVLNGISVSVQYEQLLQNSTQTTF